MSLTKRTWTTPIVKSHTLTFTGSVSGATTKLSIVFQAAGAIYGMKSSINVYVNGTKQSCTWTTNKTEKLVDTTYKTKMTSSQMTISKPFFTLKLTDSSDGEAFYEETFSFYEIEKTPTAATCSGGVMDGTTKSKVTFTTSGTDATYKATFTLGTYSGSATSTTKELQYAIPIAWCNAVPNATTGKANVVCQVLYGGQVYSSISTTITVSVPASVKPTLTAITLADKTNTPVPSAWNMFVQHQSGVRVSAITTAGAYSSTIKTIKLQVGTQSTSKDYSASALPQIDTITQSGSLTCTVTVTDSRGRTASKTATVTFVAYAAPKFTKCVSERATAAGELDNDGTYFKSTTSITYSACNSKNAITLTVKYKKTDAVLYGTAATITPGVNTCGGDLNTEFSYDVLYTVKDQFTTVTYIDYVSTAIYLMHFLHGGRGVAFGQKATMEGYLDCAFKALFRDQVFFMTGNGVQVDVRDIITLGTQTLTSFGNGLYLCAKDGKLIADVPTIGTGTPTSLTNGQFLYANNGKIGSRTIPLSALTDGVIKAGDSVTTANMVMNGYITSSSTELFFEVPLGKLITAASATVTAGTFTARTINGYAYNKASGSGGKYSGLTATDFTPVVALNKPSGTVRIRLLNSTKWTQSSGTAITNNTPISVVGTLTLKFA